jgi:hypothetical protein
MKLFKNRRADSCMIKTYNDFFYESELLYPDSELEKRKERLRSIGLCSSRPYRNICTEIKRRISKKCDIEMEQYILEASEYFYLKYPEYKFISGNIIHNICKKYDLDLREISEYIGEVDDDQLNEIENFKIDDCDKFFPLLSDYPSKDELVLSIEYDQIMISKGKYEDSAEYKYNNPCHPRKNKSSMVVISRHSDFLNSIRGTTKFSIPDMADNGYVIPLPIVLQPVQFKGIIHYLYVTTL